MNPGDYAAGLRVEAEMARLRAQSMERLRLERAQPEDVQARRRENLLARYREVHQDIRER